MMLSVLAAACVAVSGSIASDQMQDSSIAFLDVSVVPMDRERVLTHQTVLVQGHRITAMGPVDSVPVSPDAVRIDGQGKFLMPGLADMHAHISQDMEEPAPDSVAERVLFLYLANGITTIRNMAGYPGVLALRQRAAKGQLLSPVIYTAGPMLNESTYTPEEVQAQKAAGYDFLKMYFLFEMEPDFFDSVMATAHAAGMRVAGHVPHGISIETALNARYASIEHLDGYLNYITMPATDSLDSAADSFQFALAIVPGLDLPGPLDRSKIQEIAAATRRAGVWNCPTIGVAENMGLDTSVLMQRPEMRYVSPATLKLWSGMKRGIRRLEPVFRWQAEVRQELALALYKTGAGLLLGADGNFWFTVPGFSIHRELELLVAAGLTPYQALETGTRNPAVYLGTADQTGTVMVGKRADLVLLEGDPLADIRHTAHPAGVMIGGRWLSRDTLDARLATMLKGI